jgi:regulator of RNase E activity RraA
VGDRDGIAVVPRAHASEVLGLVRDLVKKENARIAEINAGTIFKAEIDDALRRKGIIQ